MADRLEATTTDPDLTPEQVLEEMKTDSQAFRRAIALLQLNQEAVRYIIKSRLPGNVNEKVIDSFATCVIDVVLQFTNDLEEAVAKVDSGEKTIDVKKIDPDVHHLKFGKVTKH